jgi:hypothetical protein
MRAVEQQGFGGAADAGAAHLGVDHDGAGHGRIGRLVDIDVAQAFEMGEDRHAGIGLDAGDEALAAARHDDIDRPPRPVSNSPTAARSLTGIIWIASPAGRRLQALDQAGMDGAGGMERVRSAAQDDGIARFEAERAGVGRDIGTAFIDHADDAKRRAHALDPQPVGAVPGGDDIADRIGQGGNGADAGNDRIDAGIIELEPVDEGGRHAACERRFDIERIGVENFLAACGNRVSHGFERGILLVG